MLCLLSTVPENAGTPTKMRLHRDIPTGCVVERLDPCRPLRTQHPLSPSVPGFARYRHAKPYSMHRHAGR